MTNKTILVTGGTGYLGSWVVKYLLEKGYHVRLCSRQIDHGAKFAHLHKVADQASGKMELIEADLLQLGSFDVAAQGCEAIMHIASPFTLSFKDAQKEIIDPAIIGTQNVLQAANNSSTVTKVVLTSSTAAVNGDCQDMADLGLTELTEDHFNSSSTPTYQPYSYSKVAAERAAWDIYNNQDQWELVVMNPSFIMGPPLSPFTKSESIKFMRDIMKGKLFMGAPALYFGVVDVRDVASAHIIGLEKSGLKGRHILAEDVYNIKNLTDIIKKIYPGRFKLPAFELPKKLIYSIGWTFGLTLKYISRNVGHPVKFNTQKSKSKLGMSYRPLEETLGDMVGQMSIK